MIPGMLPILNPSPNFSLYLLSNEQNVDVFARVGSPTVAVTVDVTIPAGVVISSASSASASIVLTGLADGSTVNLHVDGDIIGAGGAGANGSTGSSHAPTGWGFYGGGGGGGFGLVGGAGGDGVTSAGGTGTPGSAGNSADPDVGGAAGVSTEGATPEVWDQIYAASDGGNCISVLGFYPSGSFNLNLSGSGNIFPGGGGGAGGYRDPSFGAQQPGDGGASGVFGQAAQGGGAGGQPGNGGHYLERSSSPNFVFSSTFTGDIRGSFSVSVS